MTSITKDDITVKQLNAFIRLRNRGIINMCDIVTGARLIGESEEVYETILWNFKYLVNKFSKKHG